jgi:hypothetical protein
MSALDTAIGHLYAGPLDAFTAARNALAKTAAGDDRARVKALEKPTLVAWTVNQVYWHARPAYDRVMKAGGALRRAQIDALQGKKSDVREATAAHRDAIAAAVKEAGRLADAVGSHPTPDALARTFEAISLAADPPPPGRLVEAVQPSGFEALAGVQPRVREGQERREGRDGQEGRERQEEHHGQDARAAAKAERLDAKREAAAAKKRQETIHKAEAAVAHAQAAEREAHEAWLRSQRDLDEARQRLTRARVE